MTSASARTDRRAGVILACIALAEGAWLVFNLRNRVTAFFRYCGFIDSPAGLAGWASALAVALLFIAFSARLPSVRENLFRPSFLKLLAILVAIASGFCEEVIFRKWLMDSLQHSGYGVAIQLLGSALAFGLAHAVWGLIRGSIGAAFRITLVTGVLGLALALVYLASHRIVMPCIVAHFLINCFAEPGLVLAAVRGEMSRAAGLDLKWYVKSYVDH